MHKRRVTVESPYAGDVETNLAYLDRCLLDSISRGEAPLASHKFYTSFLDDTILEERDTGIECGLAWAECAEAMCFYTDLGFSSGMKRAEQRAVDNGTPREYREIGV